MTQIEKKLPNINPKDIKYISDSLSVVIDSSEKIKEGDYVYDSKLERVEVATGITVTCQTDNRKIHSLIIATIGIDGLPNVTALEADATYRKSEIEKAANKFAEGETCFTNYHNLVGGFIAGATYQKQVDDDRMEEFADFIQEYFKHTDKPWKTKKNLSKYSIQWTS